MVEDELTKERWEYQKLIGRVGRYWNYHNTSGLVAIPLFLLMLAAAAGLAWLIGPQHPNLAHNWILAGKVLFAGLGSILLICFVFASVSSAVYHHAARKAYDELFYRIQRITVTDVAGQKNHCTVVHPYGGRPFILQWVPKHELADAIEDFSKGQLDSFNKYRHV